MNPRAATTAKKQTDPKISPFDVITQHEQEEEARLNAVLEALREEEISAERAMTESEKHAEEKLREEAKKELLAYKDAIGKELAKSEKDLDKDLEKIEALYEERASKVIQAQVAHLLSLES